MRRTKDIKLRTAIPFIAPDGQSARIHPVSIDIRLQSNSEQAIQVVIDALKSLDWLAEPE
jgi:hypothetical protein